jgi:O-antigen/teichoic acid export membrane protein
MKPGNLWRSGGGFFTNFVWQIASAAASAVIGFGYLLYLGRTMSADQFGLFSLGAGAILVSFQLCDFRLVELLVRFLTEYKQSGERGKSDALVLASFVLSTVSCAASIIICSVAGTLFYGLEIDRVSGEYYFVFCALFAAPGILCNAPSLAILRIEERFEQLAILNIAVAAGKLLVVFLMNFRGQLTALDVVIAAGIVSLAGNGVQMALALRAYGKLRRLSIREAHSALAPDRSRLRVFFLRNYAFSIVGVPSKDLDVTLLGYFGDLRMLGSYRIAKSFVGAIGVVADSAFFVCYPEIVRIRRDGADAVRRYVIRLAKLLGLLGLFLFGTSIIVVPFLVARLFGAELQAAGKLYCILAVGTLIWPPLVWVNPVLLAFDRAGKSVLAALLGGLTSLILLVVLIPLFGAVGAAISWVTGGAVGLLVALHLANRHVFFPEQR